MNCYVCGFPRPEGAKYCPGCGRYCADDPNVRQASTIPTEDIIIEEPTPVEVPVDLPEALPMEESVPDTPTDPEPQEETESAPIPEDLPAPVPEPVTAPETPTKQKKHRPVLIPALIMAGLFLVGSVCRFLIPKQPVSVQIPTESTEPGVNKDYKIPLPGQKGNPQSGGSSAADEHQPTDDRCFRMENGIVSFIPERYDGSPILVIPTEIDGQTVTGIAPGGFAELEDVTTLVLPDSLETIGDSAFANCRKLRGVYIPDSVNSIGKGAFSGCIDMESVSIPVGTSSIGADAFDGCASLMYIFYEGTYEQWMALYNEYVTPFTYAICSDGDYYHGVNLP